MHALICSKKCISHAFYPLSEFLSLQKTRFTKKKKKNRNHNSSMRRNLATGIHYSSHLVIHMSVYVISKLL